MVNLVDSRRRLLTTAGLAGTGLLMGLARISHTGVFLGGNLRSA